MAFFKRQAAAPQDEPVRSTELEVAAFGGQPIELSGTTTFGAAALDDLFTAHRHGDRAPLILAARLVPEPTNPHDPYAVAVHVEGAHVAYLPGHLAKLAPPGVRELRCSVQLWSAPTGSGRRVRGWIAVGTHDIAWPHTLADPPAITVEDRRAERAAATSAMVTGALVGGGDRRRQFKRGMVGRFHYLETVEPIQQLKREKRYEEALELCIGAISAAEKDRGEREPAPWYTEQAAIILRKLGRHEDERSVLERWLEACPENRRAGSSIQLRLAKLTR